MKQIDGQMNLFDYVDEQQGKHMCVSCAKAKFKERVKDSNFYFCGEMHCFITEHTFDWICKQGRGRSMFERRTE